MAAGNFALHGLIDVLTLTRFERCHGHQRNESWVVHYQAVISVIWIPYRTLTPDNINWYLDETGWHSLLQTMWILLPVRSFPSAWTIHLSSLLLSDSTLVGRKPQTGKDWLRRYPAQNRKLNATCAEDHSSALFLTTVEMQLRAIKRVWSSPKQYFD